MTSIQKKYKEVVIPEMKKRFNLANDLEVPKVTKIVVNTGIGKYLKDGNISTEIIQSLATITGQKPVVTKAKKSIAGFKIRQGLEIGIKVTLRGQRKWDFLEKLVGAAIPRIRDFRGIKESAVDHQGNLNIGIKEHLIFPEILPEQVKNIFSLQVTAVTDAGDREKGLALFRLMGFPIENKE